MPHGKRTRRTSVHTFEMRCGRHRLIDQNCLDKSEKLAGNSRTVWRAGGADSVVDAVLANRELMPESGN
jgi:hypothetical protein